MSHNKNEIPRSRFTAGAGDFCIFLWRTVFLL